MNPVQDPNSYRALANVALTQAQTDLNNYAAGLEPFDPMTFKDVLRMSLVVDGETNMGARIGVLQNLETKCLAILQDISNAVAALQTYETSVTNPSALGSDVQT